MVSNSSIKYNSIGDPRFQLDTPKVMSTNTTVNSDKFYPVEQLLSTTSPYYQNEFIPTPSSNNYMYSQPPSLANPFFDDFLTSSSREKQERQQHHHQQQEEEGINKSPLSPIQYSTEPPYSPHSPVSPHLQHQQQPPLQNNYLEHSLSPKKSSDLNNPTTNQRQSKALRHFKCFNCKVTKTPLWRRTPDRLQTLCNACGLYFKQYNHHRPLHVQHKTTNPFSSNSTSSSSTSSSTNSYTPKSQNHRTSSSSSHDSEPSSTNEVLALPPTVCTNCQQTQTPVWRKNKMGEPLCNACGLYVKLHNRSRPVEMRKSTIQRRRRDWSSSVPTAEETSKDFNTSISQAILGSATDHQVATLLQQMDSGQIEYFLHKLENRCHLFRSALNHSQDLRLNNS